MVDLHAIISEAGAEGIRRKTLEEKSNLKKADLDDQIKHLRSQQLIFGPFRTGKGNLFYGKGCEPNIDSAGTRIEELIRNAGAKLLAKRRAPLGSRLNKQHLAKDISAFGTEFCPATPGPLYQFHSRGLPPSPCWSFTDPLRLFPLLCRIGLGL